ncbi:MAG: aminotransferase [Pseudopedobacter saltans]|uniref:Aminotransferase n=1 Tax=Pseudopedobacter saltans TaxID=151895 RepID=A0A2W5EPR0_9SPHI|nr:MAG: aminotransferase [Pseudopedobacter saltans]
MSIYFNTASCGLISEQSADTSVLLYEKFSQNASEASNDWQQRYYWSLKSQIASFIHCNINYIAFIPNMSYGINMIIQSLKGNEKILLYEKDFPSLNQPFENNHFNITYVKDTNDFEIQLEDIEILLKRNSIDIVAISQVQFKTGFNLDILQLSRLCKQYNTWLIIDGTQSLGALELNFDCNAPDVFIASNYKWMNAGYGTGILFMNDEFISQFPPVISGNHSSSLVQEHPDAPINLYEPGHINMHGLAILETELKRKKEISIEKIEQHNLELTHYFLENIKELPLGLVGNYNMENRSSIVSIYNDKNLSSYLSQNGIVITDRFGLIRFSFHYYNTKDELDQLISILKD